MNKIKKYVVILMIMFLVSVMMLLILSVLTYLFKWKADTAMIGIVVTYVLTGFVGGLSLRWMEERECEKTNRTRIRKKTIEASILSGVFIIFLLICSVFVFQIPFEFSVRVLMVFLLIWGSCFLGRR